MTKDINSTVSNNPINAPVNTTEVKSEVETIESTSNTTSKTSTKTKPASTKTKAKTTSKKSTPKQPAQNIIGEDFILEQVAHFNTKKVHHFNDKYNSVLEYYPIFSKIKKDELIQELLETVNYCRTNKNNHLTNDYEIRHYALFLVIKHFTSFKNVLDGKDYDYHVMMSKHLYDIGLHDTIILEILDFEQVQSVLDQLELVESTAKSLVKIIAEEEEKIKNNTVNLQVTQKGLEALDNYKLN